MKEKPPFNGFMILLAVASFLVPSSSVRPCSGRKPSRHDEFSAANVAFPTGKKHVLENGLTIVVDRNDSSATTIIDILIRGGQKADPPGKEGLSWLTTRLAVEIAEREKTLELMELSSIFSTESAGDFSSVRINCLSTHLDRTLAILTQSLEDPILSGLRIDAVKERMVHLGKRERDDSIRQGHDAALSAFFGNAGCGAPPYGTEASLKSLAKKDVVSFYKTRFTAGNMIVAVSSDLAEEKLLEILKKHLLKIARGDPAAFPSARPVTPDDRRSMIGKQTKQVFISRVFALPPLTSKNYVLSYLLENLLGKGPASRLWLLRTEKSLAYNVSATATMMKDGGILEAFLETSQEKSEPGRRSLIEVIEKVQQDGCSLEEFVALKTAVRAEFLRWNETKNIRNLNTAEFEMWGLGQEFFSEFFEVLEGISRNDLNDFLRQVLDPGNSMEIVIGPGNDGALPSDMTSDGFTGLFSPDC